MSRPAAPQRRVLLFSEDERELERQLDEFQRAGFQVVLAEALPTAVQALREKMPDVAVLHSHRPDDDVGLLAATVLMKYRGTRVVVLTSYQDAHRDETLRDLGVSAIERWPLPFGELLRLVVVREPTKLRLTSFAAVSRKQLDALESLHRRAPSDPDTSWLLGFAYYRAGRFEEALPLLRGVVDHVDARAQVLYYLGACLYQLDRVAEARPFWEQAAAQTDNATIATRAREHLQRLER